MQELHRKLQVNPNGQGAGEVLTHPHVLEVSSQGAVFSNDFWLIEAPQQLVKWWNEKFRHYLS